MKQLINNNYIYFLGKWVIYVLLLHQENIYSTNLQE